MVSEHKRAASALQAVDPGCDRESWVKAGMAAKAAELDFEEFHRWSASAGNYAGENDCRTVWKSFGESGLVTAASLFAMAFAQGWNDPTRRASRNSCALIHRPAKAAPAPTVEAESIKAARVWELCEPAAPSPLAHPYMTKKGGVTDGLRVYPSSAPPLMIQGQNVAGWLVVPCWSGDKLQTLQFVPSEGAKLNLPGASFNDGFFTRATEKLLVIPAANRENCAARIQQPMVHSLAQAILRTCNCEIAPASSSHGMLSDFIQYPNHLGNANRQEQRLGTVLTNIGKRGLIKPCSIHYAILRQILHNEVNEL
jgi:hypothetical protein